MKSLKRTRMFRLTKRKKSGDEIVNVNGRTRTNTQMENEKSLVST